MSVQAISWALGKAGAVDSTQAKLGSQAVLLVLANYADQWGITFVGQDTLAQDCAGVSDRTIRTHLTYLEEAGLIARFHRNDQRGNRTSDTTVLAPLAEDRGQMQDAHEDKLALEKHPEEACRVAQRNTSSGDAYRKVSSSHQRKGSSGDQRKGSSGRQPEEVFRGTVSTGTVRENRQSETASASASEHADHAEEWQPEDNLALTRLARFVDLKLQHGLGKPEYRQDALDKTDWLTAFRELSDRTDEEFEAALAGMVSPMRLKDPKWRRRIQGARSAQVFATEFNKLAEAPATTMTTGNLRRLV